MSRSASASLVLPSCGASLTQAIPPGAPRSLYVWLGGACAQVGLVVAGWRRAHWPRRICGVVAVVLAAGVGGQRGQPDVPVLPDLRPPARQERQPLPGQCAAQRHARPGGQDRPAARPRCHPERFHPRDQPEVHAPARPTCGSPRPGSRATSPSCRSSSCCTAPPAILLTGLESSYADATALAFAEQHHGVAPILVMPDINGSFGADSECVNSATYGEVETYLTKTVPQFMRKNFNAKHGSGVDRDRRAVRGRSVRHHAGPATTPRSTRPSPTTPATCRPPTRTRRAADHSGLVRRFAAGYDAHNPPYLLTHQRFTGLSGWFEAGTQDT